MEKAAFVAGGSCRLWETMQQFHLCLRLILFRLWQEQWQALCNDAVYLPAPWNFCRQSLCVLVRFTLGHMQSNILIQSQKYAEVNFPVILGNWTQLRSARVARHPRMLSEHCVSYRSMLNTIVSKQVHVTRCITFVMRDGYIAKIFLSLL